MIKLEYLLVIAVLLIGAALMRGQFDRAVGEVTHPDPDATPLFPVVTPVVKPICSGAYHGSECLLLP